MNSDVMPSIVQMDPEVLKSLLTEVKETVAIQSTETNETANSFGIVQMWNMRKRMHTARTLWNRNK